MRVDPKARRTGQGPPARAHLAALGRLDGAADRMRSTASRSGGRPTSVGRHPVPVRGPRRMAQTSAAAGPLEGMEASPHAEAQPASARYLRANARQWASRARGTGASQAPNPSPSPCPTPTGPHSACRDSPIPTAASGMPSEPPDADPHVRWCGGRRGEPGAYPIPGSSSTRGSPSAPGCQSARSSACSADPPAAAPALRPGSARCCETPLWRPASGDGSRHTSSATLTQSR